jgi:hypothetical protein
VREHQIRFVAEQLSDARVGIGAARESGKRLNRFTRDARLFALRQRRPPPAVEREHAVENPPALDGFIDVRMTHAIS